MRHGARFGKHNSTGGKAAVGATPGLTRNIAGFQVLSLQTFAGLITQGISWGFDVIIWPSSPLTCCNSSSHTQDHRKHKHKCKAKLGSSNSTLPGVVIVECWCKVGERPTAFLMDTPGVMLPNVPDEQTGMRLALTGDPF